MERRTFLRQAGVVAGTVGLLPLFKFLPGREETLGLLELRNGDDMRLLLKAYLPLRTTEWGDYQLLLTADRSLIFDAVCIRLASGRVLLDRKLDRVIRLAGGDALELTISDLEL